MKTCVLLMSASLLLAALPAGMVLAGSSSNDSGGSAAAKSGAQKGGGDVHWSYTGEEGPENWAELSAAFEVCDAGHRQSPIDIVDEVRAELVQMRRAYGVAPLDVVNNGHTVQVNVRRGSRLKVANKTFELLQFHFHTPSEHAVDGKRYPMEAHFVHRSDSGELAVVGVFMRVGQENAFLDPVWEQMPRTAGGRAKASYIELDLAAFFPRDQRYSRYFGSLTTPPCSEGVNWYVMAEPVEISEAQLKRFQSVVGDNSRPLQPPHERFVLRVD